MGSGLEVNLGFFFDWGEFDNCFDGFLVWKFGSEVLMLSENKGIPANCLGNSVYEENACFFITEIQ